MGIRNIGFLTNRDQTVREVIKELGDIPEGTIFVVKDCNDMNFDDVSVDLEVTKDMDVLSEIPEDILGKDVQSFRYYRNPCSIIIEY